MSVRRQKQSPEYKVCINEFLLPVKIAPLFFTYKGTTDMPDIGYNQYGKKESNH